MAIEKRIQLPKAFLTHVESLLEALAHGGIGNLSRRAQDEFKAVLREDESDKF